MVLEAGLAEAVRSSLSKMWSCATQAPGRQQVCFSGSGFWPNRWDGGRGGNSNVHLLCWCSLENSHSGPHLPISQHFLTPYCIPKPVLGTKIPRNMEKRYPKRLSVKRKTRVCFKGLPKSDSEKDGQCKKAIEEMPCCLELPEKQMAQTVWFG